MEKQQSINDIQIGGNHYDKSGEQHWDRAWRLGWDFYQYQITKYVERWKKKNGIEDLKKAQHFLNKYIEVVEREEASLKEFKDGQERRAMKATDQVVLSTITSADQRAREQENLAGLAPGYEQRIPDRF